MQRKYRLKEGVSPEPQLPGNPREPGLREVAGNATRTTDQVNARLRFFPVFKKMTVNGRDITQMTAEEGKATSWRLCETIRVRELTATHRLGQIRRFLMLEEQKTWKREFGFNRIETAAEMDEKGFRASPVSEPFFYRNMSNSRHPHTPDEFTLEMNVYVERLRMKIVLSQPAPPQYDPLPRRAAIDSGSD